MDSEELEHELKLSYDKMYVPNSSLEDDDGLSSITDWKYWYGRG